MKVPWTASPLVVIDLTRWCSTWPMKYGLNGTVTRGCEELWLKITDSSTLIASSAMTK